MELYVFDKQMNPLTIINNFDSLRWLTDFNGLDEFELNAYSDEINEKFLINGNVLWKNDSDNAMVIESVSINGNNIVCRGKGIKRFLCDRIIKKQLNVTNVEQAIRKAIQDNAIDNRKVEFLKLGELKGYADRIDSQFTYAQLDEFLSSFSNFGYSVNYDFVRKELVFNLFKGDDKSETIFFSEEFDNISNVVINDNSTEYKNYAIVGGQGEGEERVIVEVDNRKSIDEEIRELWVDAKDISKEYELGEETLTYTEEEYKNVLNNRGLKKLNEKKHIKSFSATVVSNSSYRYKDDYIIGDVVTCFSRKYGVKLKARINAVQEVYDSSGYNIHINIINI